MMMLNHCYPYTKGTPKTPNKFTVDVLKIIFGVLGALWDHQTSSSILWVFTLFDLLLILCSWWTKQADNDQKINGMQQGLLFSGCFYPCDDDDDDDDDDDALVMFVLWLIQIFPFLYPTFCLSTPPLPPPPFSLPCSARVFISSVFIWHHLIWYHSSPS